MDTYSYNQVVEIKKVLELIVENEPTIRLGFFIGIFAVIVLKSVRRGGPTTCRSDSSWQSVRLSRARI